MQRDFDNVILASPIFGEIFFLHFNNKKMREVYIKTTVKENCLT